MRTKEESVFSKEVQRERLEGIPTGVINRGKAPPNMFLGRSRGNKEKT